MKELPDETTLLELLELAKVAEEKAKTLYDLATEIDEKWRMKLEKRRPESIVQSVGSRDTALPCPYDGRKYLRD